MSRAAVAKAGRSSWEAGGWRLYIYGAVFGLASIGITAATAAVTGKALLWGITTGESKLGGLAASLSLGEFGLRHFPNRWMLLQAVVGGFLLG